MKTPLRVTSVALTLLALIGCGKSSKAPAAPPQPADVVIVGLPLGAMLSVDGTPVGPTPQRVSLGAGSHTFALSGFTGYADSTLTHSVAAGSAESLKVDLRPLPGTPTTIEIWDMPFAGGTLRETPNAIDATQGGDIWVASATGVLYRFNASGALQAQWTASGMGGSGSLAVSDTRIAYASSNAAAVGLYSLTGTPIHFLTSMPTNAINEWQPMPHPSLDEFASDYLFCAVTDHYGTSTQIQRYAESDGHYISRWPLHSDVNIPNPVARYVACDDAHQVFVIVVGNGNTALDKYAEDGTFLERRLPYAASNVDVRGGVAYSVGGLITRTDLATGATHSWRLTQGRIPTSVSGMVVSADGLFIADGANRRVLRYVLE